MSEHTKNSRLDLALVCDDVRNEIGGKKTLVGVKRPRFKKPKNGNLLEPLTIWARFLCEGGEELKGMTRLVCVEHDKRYTESPFTLVKSTKDAGEEIWEASLSLRWGNNFFSGHTGDYRVEWSVQGEDSWSEIITISYLEHVE